MSCANHTIKMVKSKLFLVVTIILSTSGVEPKAVAKDAPYPAAGFRPQGRAFNLPGEEELPTTTEKFLETTTGFGEDYTTTELPEGVNRLGRSFDEDEEKVLTTIRPGIAQYKENGEKIEIIYAIPASDSLKLGTDEFNVTTEDPTTVRPDDEITTFAPVDSEHKLIEDKARVTKLYPINEAKLGKLRISDEEEALNKKGEDEMTTEANSNDEATTFVPIKEHETADLKAQVETIDPEEVSAEAEKLITSQEPTLKERSEDDIDPLKLAEKEQAEENKARAEEALEVLFGTTKDAEEELLNEEVGSDEKVILDPALPAETRFERFYLVHDGTLHDFEHIQQYYDESVKDEPLVISQQEVLVPADLPFVYSAQVQRLLA